MTFAGLPFLLLVIQNKRVWLQNFLLGLERRAWDDELLVSKKELMEFLLSCAGGEVRNAPFQLSLFHPLIQ